MTAKSKGRGVTSIVTADLRSIVQRSGRSLYDIETSAGIARGALSRFMRGGGISAASVDRLADVLNLRLIEVAARPARRSRSAV